MLDECRASLAMHPRKLRELAALRSSSSSSLGGRFLPALCTTLTLLFEILRRSLTSDCGARFAAACTSTSAVGDGGNGFLEGFLRFLLAAAHSIFFVSPPPRPTRNPCQRYRDLSPRCVARPSLSSTVTPLPPLAVPSHLMG